MAEFGGGLFGCFSDCGVCCMASLCPCVLFGQNAEKAGEGSCITFTLLYLTSACCCTVAGYLRGKIQLRLGYMDSGQCTNCCVHCCCCPCALSQEARALMAFEMGAPPDLEMQR